MKYNLPSQAGYKTISSAVISVHVIGVVLEHPEVAQLQSKFLDKGLEQKYLYRHMSIFLFLGEAEAQEWAHFFSATHKNNLA